MIFKPPSSAIFRIIPAAKSVTSFPFKGSDKSDFLREGLTLSSLFSFKDFDGLAFLGEGSDLSVLLSFKDFDILACLTEVLKGVVICY